MVTISNERINALDRKSMIKYILKGLHALSANSANYRIECENGYIVSLARGLQCECTTNPSIIDFEVAILNKNQEIVFIKDLWGNDGIKGYQTPEDIINILKKVSKL